MERTADVQGEIIGIGTVVAVLVLGYGVLVGDTIAGIETMTVAGWVLSVTLVGVAAVHASVGQYNFTWGFGGAAVGLVFVFTGEGSRVLLGLTLLVLSGLYVALLTRRRSREIEAADP